MKIDVRCFDLEPAELIREHAVRRVHFHLSRFGVEVDTVAVRIVDENGPRGGRDKRCRITVRGPAVGSATAQQRSPNPYEAADLACAAVARAVGRNVERSRRGGLSRVRLRTAS